MQECLVFQEIKKKVLNSISGVQIWSKNRIAVEERIPKKSNYWSHQKIRVRWAWEYKPMESKTTTKLYKGDGLPLGCSVSEHFFLNMRGKRIPVAIWDTFMIICTFYFWHRVTGQEVFVIYTSDQFSCSVVSISLQPHELQHIRPPCPSPIPRVYQTPLHWVGDAI